MRNYYNRKVLIVVCLAIAWIILPYFLSTFDLVQPVSFIEGKDLPSGLATLVKAHEIEIGAFVAVNPPTAEMLKAFERLSGRHVSSVLWYQGWNASDQPLLPTATLIEVRDHDGYDTHTISHVTWEPWVDLKDIADGVYDPYLTSYATEARDWGEIIRLRFAHEMIQNNVLDGGEWYPWQDQPADYIAAFRHAHDVFDAVGATNVEFVWCPNNYPFDLNVVRLYYPGSDYVDWLCMDGYNWSNRDGQPGWPDWQWFDDIFYNLYHTFIDNENVFGEKPVMIGEFSSCEAGPHEQPEQTKAAWITNTFDRIESSDYSKIQAFYWFNIDKECDWRINSSPESLNSFRTAITDSCLTSHCFSLNGDGDASMEDVRAVAVHWGKQSTGPDWDDVKQFDLDWDEIITVRDIMLVIAQLGKTCL